MTGKKSKNLGQRNRYYVWGSHPAIVSAEVFDKVQVFDAFILIFRTDESQDKKLFRND